MRRDIFQCALNEEKHMEVNIRYHLLQAVRDDLRKKGYITSEELKKRRNGEYVRFAGRPVLVHMPPTRSGKRIIFVTLEDEWGIIDTVLFPSDQEENAEVLLGSPVVLCEGVVRRLGKRDVSVVIKKVKELMDVYKSDGKKNPSFNGASQAGNLSS